MIGGIVREILVGLGVIVVAGPLVGIGVARPLVFGLATLALLVSGAQLGVLAGTYARSRDDVYSLETLVVLPLGFLSGIFYSVTKLPQTWQILSYLNPVFYFVEAIRDGLLGHADLSPVVSLTVIAGITLVLTAWSLAVFRSAKQLKP